MLIEPSCKLTYASYQALDIDIILHDSPGRLIVTMPSGAIAQMRSIMSAAVRNDKRIVILGSGIKKGARLALKKWDSAPPSNSILFAIKDTPDENDVIMVTGSQGETTSVLAQITSGVHSRIQTIPADTVLEGVSKVLKIY